MNNQAVQNNLKLIEIAIEKLRSEAKRTHGTSRVHDLPTKISNLTGLPLDVVNGYLTQSSEEWQLKVRDTK